MATTTSSCRIRALLHCVATVAVGCALAVSPALAQPLTVAPNHATRSNEAADPNALAEAALAGPADTPAGEQPDRATSTAGYLELTRKGGWIMVVIGLMSVLVGAVAIERVLGLRRSRVAPRSLVRGLRQLAEVGDFEPRAATRMCEDYPSSLARIVTAAAAKGGRPHAEVEAAAAAATQREADRLYSNVRTLNMAAAVTPLMGLLGTVGGMIQAFIATATLPLGSNKGQALAEGIYVALVTTFAGLAVAIPAAVLAHFFESRILKLSRSIEELMVDLLPRLERFEGGPRVDLTGGSIDGIEADGSMAGNGVDWPHPGAPNPKGPIAAEAPTETWHG